MMGPKMRIKPSTKIRGKITVPSDKSITHRALMICSMSEGKSVVRNLLQSDDTESTLGVMTAVGGNFKGNFDRLEISPASWREAAQPLNCGNSGTTTRLVTGLLSTVKGFHVLHGDDSLSKRPMKRVIEPLKNMGACIAARREDSLLPVALVGKSLNGFNHELPVASAQVKSALLLAAVRTAGKTCVSEPESSRDHTERMLRSMGAVIKTTGKVVEVYGGSLSGLNFTVPGDFSSAAFFLTLAILHENASITVENVGLNETRIGLLKVLKEMGAEIEWIVKEYAPEPLGTVTARTSRLRGIEVDTLVPSMIDELPLLALVGALAEGTTTLRGAGELRKKESDRISVTVENFRKLGIEIIEREDGFVVKGPQEITGGMANSRGDHRMAMLFSVAGCLSREGVEIDGSEVVKISFPGFFKTLEEVCS